MAAESVRLARMQARENDKARMWALLTDPRVLSALTMIGGVYAVEKMRFSDDEGRNQRLKAAVLAALIYQALSMAGAKGWPAAVGSLVGGVALGSSGGGTAWSPLQLGEAAGVGALVGSVVPGVGTLAGAGVGAAVDTVYQWVT